MTATTREYATALLRHLRPTLNSEQVEERLQRIGEPEINPDRDPDAQYFCQLWDRTHEAACSGLDDDDE